MIRHVGREDRFQCGLRIPRFVAESLKVLRNLRCTMKMTLSSTSGVPIHLVDSSSDKSVRNGGDGESLGSALWLTV